MELQLANDLSEIGRVNSAFDEFAARENLPDSVRRSIKLAIDELLNNVISYAFTKNRDHHLEVQFETAGDRVVLVISDDGPPFDPLDRDDPDLSVPLQERAVGGLGLFFVRRLMDSVDYERVGDRNVIRLTKVFESR